jgi:hypothetical protein
MPKFMSSHTVPAGAVRREQINQIAQAAQNDPTVQPYRSFLNLSEGKIVCIMQAPNLDFAHLILSRATMSRRHRNKRSEFNDLIEGGKQNACSKNARLRSARVVRKSLQWYKILVRQNYCRYYNLVCATPPGRIFAVRTRPLLMQ